VPQLLESKTKILKTIVTEKSEQKNKL